MEIEAYIQRIGYHGSLEPTVTTLMQLHRAHMLHVPFENFDITLGIPIDLSLPALYHKIVVQRRGGFCYELNTMFGWLLQQLGFPVMLLSGRVMNATQPGPEFDHLLLLVEHDERWIADVGFGDSFLEPLAVDRGDAVWQDGSYYRVEGPDSAKYLYQRRGSADWTPQYQFSVIPHRLSEFRTMCHYHQTSPDSVFTQRSVCSRATPDGRVTISNNRVIITAQGRRQLRTMNTPDEYRQLLAQLFGFELPQDIPVETLMRTER